ncbi:hypothetical protein L6452_43796 [Arctium lappa]|uniref:Uncharacterized protein n=1 Tax=Arctium lappa TaxID=4217 RepID=A0ACB8XDG9_ARCLA|nr:hypothetical protein L6452_43796 [Arctium lappa]
MIPTIDGEIRVAWENILKKRFPDVVHTVRKATEIGGKNGTHLSALREYDPSWILEEHWIHMVQFELPTVGQRLDNDRMLCGNSSGYYGDNELKLAIQFRIIIKADRVYDVSTPGIMPFMFRNRSDLREENWEKMDALFSSSPSCALPLFDGSEIDLGYLTLILVASSLFPSLFLFLSF